jgi:hypothetical protein
MGLPDELAAPNGPAFLGGEVAEREFAGLWFGAHFVVPSCECAAYRALTCTGLSRGASPPAGNAGAKVRAPSPAPREKVSLALASDG